MAVDPLSTSNADSERKFGAMRNTITDNRDNDSCKQCRQLAVISTVRPPSERSNPEPHVKNSLEKQEK